MPNRKDITPALIRSDSLPVRKGSRPKTVRGPLHFQSNGHGDSKHLRQLVDKVFTWPYLEGGAPFASRAETIPIRIKEIACSSDPSAFMTAREFARVLLRVPTIYLTLPLVCAHWAIVRGWAEPHYLGSFGLMPAGTVLVYTPRDAEELQVCNFLFSESYHFACRFVVGEWQHGSIRGEIWDEQTRASA